MTDKFDEKQRAFAESLRGWEYSDMMALCEGLSDAASESGWDMVKSSDPAEWAALLTTYAEGVLASDE